MIIIIIVIATCGNDLKLPGGSNRRRGRTGDLLQVARLIIHIKYEE